MSYICKLLVDTEPLPAESPLWGHPKVLITPHVASIPEATFVVRGIRDRMRALVEDSQCATRRNSGRLALTPGPLSGGCPCLFLLAPVPEIYPLIFLSRGAM